MTIGVVGVGYVGLVTAVGFAHLGHSVVAVDKQGDVIQTLNRGVPHFFEKDIEKFLAEGLSRNRLHFSTAIEDLRECNIIFVCVNTPSLPDGNADISQLYTAFSSLFDVVGDETILVVRSTVPLGTMSVLKSFLKEAHKSNSLGFCPEFLREGIALSDFFSPHRIVIASDTEQGSTILADIYKPLSRKGSVPIIVCDTFETAELIKYASNAFLAIKVAYINQISQLAQISNADIHLITKAMGYDPRIGSSYLHPGPGIGGSCLPKDTLALSRIGLQRGVDMSIITKTYEANRTHQDFIVSWVLQTLANSGVHGSHEKDIHPVPRIALWGLSYKANTDDIRDAASLNIATQLVAAGFSVCGYDPKSMQRFAEHLQMPRVSVAATALDALDGACGLVVLTEWQLFSTISAQEVRRHASSENFLVFDTRNVLDKDAYASQKIVIHGLGEGYARNKKDT